MLFEFTISLIFLIIYEIYLQSLKYIKPIIISIDGNIGSGKSTLMNILKEEFCEHTFVDEPVEEWLQATDDNDKNLLTNFYQDKNRWSYTFQNYAFITRTKKLLEAVEKHKPKNFYDTIKIIFNRIIYGKKIVIFTERSILTDRYVFAEMLHDNKDINSMEWIMYLDWYTLFEKSLKINKVIYLKTDPEKSYERVNKRARDEEKTVALEYLKAVHYKHEKWLSNSPDALILNGNTEFETDNGEKTLILDKIKNAYVI